MSGPSITLRLKSCDYAGTNPPAGGSTTLAPSKDLAVSPFDFSASWRIFRRFAKHINVLGVQILSNLNVTARTSRVATAGC